MEKLRKKKQKKHNKQIQNGFRNIKDHRLVLKQIPVSRKSEKNVCCFYGHINNIYLAEMMRRHYGECSLCIGVKGY